MRLCALQDAPMGLQDGVKRLQDASLRLQDALQAIGYRLQAKGNYTLVIIKVRAREGDFMRVLFYR